MLNVLRKETKTTLGTVSYRKCGENGPFSVVFIHGAAGDSRLFSGQLKHFGEKYPCYALDLPLHGHSMKGFPEKLELDDYVLTINDFFEQVIIGDVFIVGHSLGAGLSAKLSTVLKNKVLGYSFLSSSADLDVGKSLFSLFETDFDSFVRLFILLSFGRLGGVMLKSYLDSDSRLSQDMVNNDLQIAVNLDFTDELLKIDVPVQIVANTKDPIISLERSLEMKKYLSNYETVIFESTGHIPHFENKREFNISLENFMNNL